MYIWCLDYLCVCGILMKKHAWWPENPTRIRQELPCWEICNRNHDQTTSLLPVFHQSLQKNILGPVADKCCFCCCNLQNNLSYLSAWASPGIPPGNFWLEFLNMKLTKSYTSATTTPDGLQTPVQKLSLIKVWLNNSHRLCVVQAEDPSWLWATTEHFKTSTTLGLWVS